MPGLCMPRNSDRSSSPMIASGRPTLLIPEKPHLAEQIVRTRGGWRENKSEQHLPNYFRPCMRRARARQHRRAIEPRDSDDALGDRCRETSIRHQSNILAGVLFPSPCIGRRISTTLWPTRTQPPPHAFCHFRHRLSWRRSSLPPCLGTRARGHRHRLRAAARLRQLLGCTPPRGRQSAKGGTIRRLTGRWGRLPSRRWLRHRPRIPCRTRRSMDGKGVAMQQKSLRGLMLDAKAELQRANRGLSAVAGASPDAATIAAPQRIGARRPLPRHRLRDGRNPRHAWDPGLRWFSCPETGPARRRRQLRCASCGPPIGSEATHRARSGERALHASRPTIMGPHGGGRAILQALIPHGVGQGHIHEMSEVVEEVGVYQERAAHRRRRSCRIVQDIART